MKHQNKPSSVLIDSANNQYVLSKPGDATAHMEDLALLQDLLVLTASCFVSVFLMYLFGLPSFFGYIVAGIFLSQYKAIENAVQVETISRGLGVIFIMFFLGLEFNFVKIVKVWSISLFGSLVLLALTLAVATTLLPSFFHATLAESIIIGSSIFLSSTAVVGHFMTRTQTETSYGRNIMGVLGFLYLLMYSCPRYSFRVSSSGYAYVTAFWD